MKLVKLFWSDGSLVIYPQWVTVPELTRYFSETEKIARERMSAANAAHAVYGFKRYDGESGDLSEAKIYASPVVLADDEFHKRIQAHLTKNPNDLILAVHAR